MKINGVEIENTFAEGFPLLLSRVLITAITKKWALTAAQTATGFATSFVTCPVQAGVEGVEPLKTPDGRPGVIMLISARTKKTLSRQLVYRLGGCVLTCPTASVFDAMPVEKREGFLKIGKKIKFFGDGFEKRGKIHGLRVYRVPRMEGEFIIERRFGYSTGIADDFIIMADSLESCLSATEVAVESIKSVKGVIVPFPGGICAAGSKVGSLKYNFLKASTNHIFCPTITDKVKNTRVPKNVRAIYEIVIVGLDLNCVKQAMKVGITSAIEKPGVIKVDAWNAGGKFGPCKIFLHDVLGIR